MTEQRFTSLQFTFHAVQRMAQRKISAKAVEEALQLGRLRPGDGETIIAEYSLDEKSQLRIVFTEHRNEESRMARVIIVIRIGNKA